jgi:hypothetical protein
LNAFGIARKKGGRRQGRAALAAALLVLAVAGAAAAEKVTTAAVWRPNSGFMSRFHSRCDRLGGKTFDACFVAAMAAAGAAPAALDFARRLDGEAYLQALAETGGPIAIAHISYPFRANENDAWLLVNGRPDLIDVDDERRLALAMMRGASAYRAIARHYPQATFWPGERGMAGPQVIAGGRQFIVDYRLRNLCHACAVIGHVRFAFEFDRAGSFRGTRLVSVAAAEQ